MDEVTIQFMKIKRYYHLSKLAICEDIDGFQKEVKFKAKNEDNLPNLILVNNGFAGRLLGVDIRAKQC